MAKQELTYTFVDRNRPEELEKVLMSILVAKLQAVSGEERGDAT